VREGAQTRKLPSTSIALFPADRGESAPAMAAILRWPRYSNRHLGAYAPTGSSSRAAQVRFPGVP